MLLIGILLWGVGYSKGNNKMKTAKATQLFLTNCQWRGLAASTITTYKQQLSYLSKAFQELPTKVGDIETVLASINATQETLHSYYRTFRTFYNFMERREDITKQANPMHRISAPRVKPKIMPTLEASDINLLSVFVNSRRNDALLGLFLDTGVQSSEVGNLIRNSALLVLFLDTGIRASEATDLKRDNIKEEYILVEGKVGERTVPISDFARTLLLRLPEYEDGYVFHGHKGKMTKAGAYFIVRRALQQIGIKPPKMGPQRLRHTVGRQYLMLGGDVRSLQIILGHANITTTQKYTSLAMNDVIIKHKEYSPLQLMGVT